MPTKNINKLMKYAAAAVAKFNYEIKTPQYYQHHSRHGEQTVTASNVYTEILQCFP